MTNIEKTLARVAAAERELADARAAQAEAERESHAEAQRRRRKVWEDFAAGYDPAGLRRAVVDAGAAYRAALVNGDRPTVALTGYVAAVMRERALAEMAVGVAADGIPLPDGVRPGDTDWWCDEHGRKLPTGDQGPFVAWLGSTLESSAVIAEAQATVDAEVQAIRDAAREAYESVPGAVPPRMFRVTALTHSGDFEDAVAGGGVHFVKGTAYLPNDHPVLSYYQRHRAYEVVPAWSVPEEYARVADRATRAGDHPLGLRGGSDAPSAA